MKKIFRYFVITAIVALVSCGEENTEPGFDWFSTPLVTKTTGTIAEVMCLTSTAEGVLTSSNAGFSYAPVDAEGNTGAYVDSPIVSAADGKVYGLLSGLSPETRYSVHAYMKLGEARVQGPSSSFTTDRVAPGETVLDITSPASVSVEAEGGMLTLTYDVLNPVEGGEVSAESSAAWVGEFDLSTEGEITCRVEVNTGDVRTATITVSYPSAASRTVTVTQGAAKPSPVEKPSFGTPASSSVTANGATVSCTFSYSGGGSVSDVYFTYSSTGAEQRAAVTTATGTKSAQLSGLTPSTTYRFRLNAVIDGELYSSEQASFVTASQGGTTTGNVYRTGWAELPTEDDTNADYYYGHHICPDFSINGYAARNYTVCFSARHHCPVWVAAPRHSCYEGSASRTNAYATDPQIPSNLQYNSKSTGGGCNKGHMLGSAERTRSTNINRQVFYYTNIAPQYSSGFNTGGGGWNTLEDWIDGKVCSDTTYLVIGTYFDSFTDGYGMSATPKKIEFGGRSDVSCPTMFYIAVLRTKRGNTGKSVMNCSRDELMCAAFVRAHNNDLKGQKVSSREMMTIDELERITGHRFFVNVPNAPKDSFTASEWGL
ncbi:MAG: DNA/RNA non-specific endonuclease [Alistipes sp.]|nr:DNA/RNA non-specific endonuclease [Alistipes sp.]